MNSRMYKELFIEENHHVLNGAQHFGLDPRGKVGFTQSYERPEDICVLEMISLDVEDGHYEK